MSDYTVYTIDGCHKCIRAKSLLSSNQLPFTELKVGVTVQKDDIQKKVLESGGHAIIRTVPQIFHGDTYIGGFTELMQYVTAQKSA